MTLTDIHTDIRNVFNPEMSVNHSTTGIDIHFIDFRSEREVGLVDWENLHKFRRIVPGGQADEGIEENNHFRYPVFVPEGKTISDRGILLLHGLNERSYDKYYTWAHRLASDTGKPVILFPISFHLNRGLPQWTDRRLMSEKAVLRGSLKFGRAKNSTFVNQALSERLSESPERFFLSGLQTSYDIIRLLHDIRDGRHPLFSKGSGVDIFAYSIGGLLGQVLYISNPDELLSDSKLFLFCAGSLFGDMNGISRVIMDPPAFRRIHRYYTKELERNIRESGVFADFFNNSKIGMAFRSMITPDRFKSVREKVFKTRSRQIFAISLKKDRVIPPSKIRKAILGKRGHNMEVMDFNYPYSHEMPFPMKQTKLTDKINDAFEKVFYKAGVFLS